ncbi:hypothetical protein KKA02_04630 [Patescibacteria group bacterium]|nr:hypothetical protein [Patescibacteria group bacterium]
MLVPRAKCPGCETVLIKPEKPLGILRVSRREQVIERKAPSPPERRGTIISALITPQWRREAGELRKGLVALGEIK